MNKVILESLFHLSVSDATGGHRKRFDLEPSYAVSLATEHLKLERGGLCGHQPWHGLQAEATAYWRNCMEIRKHWTLTCCEVQLAKQLDSRVDIG